MAFYHTAVTAAENINFSLKLMFAFSGKEIVVVKFFVLPYDCKNLRDWPSFAD